MIVPFTHLPGDDWDQARPILDLTVEGAEDIAVPCLVDSGSTNTLLPGELGAVFGVDLDRTRGRRLALGGTSFDTRFARVGLGVGPHRWEAEVGFCDPWAFGWGIAGMTGFFRFFTVTFRAADLAFEVEPIDR